MNGYMGPPSQCMPVQVVGGGFSLRLEPESDWWRCDVMVEAQTPIESSFHIHMICMESVSAPWCAMNGYGSTLTVLCLFRSVDFQDFGVDLWWAFLLLCLLVSPPHPFRLHLTIITMYAKCFSTLTCCGWAYGSTLTVLHQCRSEVDLGDLGVDLSRSDDAMPWLRLKHPLECIPHPYDMCA